METDQIIELMQQKNQILIHLYKTVIQQGQLINGGNWSDLMKTLSTKQRLLTMLQQTENSLDPYRQQDPEARLWRNEADRNRCIQMATSSAELLAKIVQLEKQAEVEMSQKRDQAATELQGVHVAAEAVGAYHQMESPVVSQFNVVD